MPEKFPDLIFIVEDSRLYAKALEQFLKTRFPAARVQVFSEGEPALNSLHLKPDFIIMDYYLDGHKRGAANGLTMIQQIKAKDPEVTIFVLSGQQDVNVELAVKEAGCLYLVKNNEAFQHLEELITRAL